MCFDKIITFTQVPLLVLASLALPCGATQSETLVIEQEQFLNVPMPESNTSLEVEQEAILQTTLLSAPPEVAYGQERPEPAAVVLHVSNPVPAPKPEAESALLVELSPAIEKPPAPMEEASAAESSQPEAASPVQGYRPPARRIPSLATPEGYSRVRSPISNARRQNVVLEKVVQRSAPPVQLAFQQQPALNALLRSIMLGAERMLYPLVTPVDITSAFGWRTHPISGGTRFHSGIDFAASMGSPVLAVFGGQVISAGWMGGYGNTVLMQHGNDLRSLYAHLSEPLVKINQVVVQGTVIGRSGSTGRSTGPHLHFELQKHSNDGWVAINPSAEVQSAKQQLIAALRSIRIRELSLNP
jgi:murein DD-endopeptidase MepM/ murein hydrolase activator NlpD